jgi:hypothetical protein
MPWYSKDATEKLVIEYYKSDEQFILRIKPKNPQEEVLLVKGLPMDGNFAQVLTTINKYRQRGKEEAKIEHNSWKYIFNPDDQVLIPVMRFNYEADYNTLKQEVIKTGQKTWEIKEASQRNAFILDQFGAKVESQADLAVAAACDAPPPPPPGEEKRSHR